MKPKASLRSFLALSGSALLAITAAQADTLYWDGATPGGNAGGGGGTWDNSTANWSTATTGGTTIDWDPSDFAVFVSSAGTVNLGAPITTSGMQFNVTGYTINADTTNILTFASGNNTVTASGFTGGTVTINGTVNGGTGANVVFNQLPPTVLPSATIFSLGGASSGGWSGTTTIEKNTTLRLQDTNQALVNSGGINLQGGILLLTNAATQNTLNRVKNDAAINSYGGSIRYQNTATASTAYSESMGNLTLQGGHTSILLLNNQNQTSNSQTLTFSNISRATNSFGTIYVGSQGNLNATTNVVKNTTITTASGTNEIIGPWFYVGNETSGAEYGRYDANGNVLAMSYSGNRAGQVEANLTTAWAADANFNWNGAAALNLTQNRTLNTLRTQSNGTVVDVGNHILATNGIANNGTLTIQTTGTGYLTAAGNTGSGNAIYLGATNSALTLSAPIKNNGNPVAVVITAGINGAAINLNSANEHTGGTFITTVATRTVVGQSSVPGRTELNIAGGLGANTNRLSVQSGVLDLNSISATVGKFDGYTAGTVTGNSGAVLTVGNGTTVSDTSDFAGSIIGTGVGFTKTGAGTQILSGVNVSTGATTVSAGTLLVNGSLGASAVTVNANATLGGTGTIGGSVTVGASGILSPGASIESLAAASLSMASGSTFAYEVANNTATGADLLSVAGAISLTGVNLSFDLTTLAALAGGGWNLNDKITLISYLGTGITSGFTGYADDTDYVFGGNKWLFNYNDTVAGGNYGTDAIAGGQNRFVTMTAVTVIPEPRAALLGGLGLLALLRRRRA